MMPLSSMTIMASGTVSRIDWRWASRISSSRWRLADWARPRFSRAPNHDMAMPTKPKAAMSMRLDEVASAAPPEAATAVARLRTVAAIPGPKPPMPPAISTAGTNRTNCRLPASGAYSARRTATVSATASAAIA